MLDRIHTERPRITLWPDGQRSSKMDVSGWASSFSCSMRVDQVVGSWTVTLLPQQTNHRVAHLSRLPELYTQCRPNGVISIGHDEPGGIMLGLIDNVKRVRSRRGPSPGTGLVLSGSTLGKTIARDHIVRGVVTAGDYPKFVGRIEKQVGKGHALVRDLEGPWGPEVGRDKANVFLGVSVRDVVTWALDTCPGMQVPLLASTGGTGRPGDFIKKIDVTTWNDARIHSDEAKQFEGTVEQFIRGLIDADFYEFWIDTQPNGTDLPRAVLVLRPKPFDNPACEFLPVREKTGVTWNDFHTMLGPELHHEIDENDVWNEDLGFTDADVFSHYTVTAQRELLGNEEAFRKGLYYPCVDTFALTRTGLRSYRANVSLVDADVRSAEAGNTTNQKKHVEQVIEFRNRLVNWYRLNEYMEAGTLVVRGKDRYRVGDKVFLPWLTPARAGTFALDGKSSRPSAKGVTFYTTGVTWSWRTGEPYQCTLSVTRGHNASVIANAKKEILESAPPESRFPDHLAVVDLSESSRTLERFDEPGAAGGGAE